MSDSLFDKTDSINLGAESVKVYSWIMPLYNCPEGEMVYNIDPGSTADRAGLLEKDVIIAYDDTPALNAFASINASLKILDGETVEVHYIRSNKEYTTVFALDMDSIAENKESKESEISEPSLVDQLKELAELYQTGLLTEEQYEAAKEKLLG